MSWNPSEYCVIILHKIDILTGIHRISPVVFTTDRSYYITKLNELNRKIHARRLDSVITYVDGRICRDSHQPNVLEYCIADGELAYWFPVFKKNFKGTWTGMVQTIPINIPLKKHIVPTLLEWRKSVEQTARHREVQRKAVISV